MIEGKIVKNDVPVDVGDDWLGGGRWALNLKDTGRGGSVIEMGEDLQIELLSCTHYTHNSIRII